MGKVFRTIFGGPARSSQQSQSTSFNQAYQDTANNLSPVVGRGNQAGDMLAGLFGLNGDGAASRTALNNFAESQGMDFAMEQGNRAVTNNRAARGLFGSGSTLRRLQEVGQGVGRTNSLNFIDRLLAMQQAGLTAQNTIGATGGYSQSTSSGSSEGNNPGLLGSMFKIFTMGK